MNRLSNIKIFSQDGRDLVLLFITICYFFNFLISSSDKPVYLSILLNDSLSSIIILAVLIAFSFSPFFLPFFLPFSSAVSIEFFISLYAFKLCSYFLYSSLFSFDISAISKRRKNIFSFSFEGIFSNLSRFFNT